MDKKTADLIAKKAAINAYKLTIKKLAQYGGYDPSRPASSGGEIHYDPRTNVNRMNHDLNIDFTEDEKRLLHEKPKGPPRAKHDPEYEKWWAEHGQNDFVDTGLEGDPLSGLVDDTNHAKDKKCPECGCTCGNKKEASSKLLSVAAKYQNYLKK